MTEMTSPQLQNRARGGPGLKPIRQASPSLEATSPPIRKFIGSRLLYLESALF